MRNYTTMKKYITPETDIIIAETTENVLLKGSHTLDEYQPGGPITAGGDEDDFTPANKSLWDTNE